MTDLQNDRPLDTQASCWDQQTTKRSKPKAGIKRRCGALEEDALTTRSARRSLPEKGRTKRRRRRRRRRRSTRNGSYYLLLLQVILGTGVLLLCLQSPQTSTTVWRWARLVFSPPTKLGGPHRGRLKALSRIQPRRKKVRGEPTDLSYPLQILRTSGNCD